MKSKWVKILEEKCQLSEDGALYKQHNRSNEKINNKIIRTNCGIKHTK